LIVLLTERKDFNVSDFSNHTYPVSRKEYRCEWCGEPIPKGEKHLHYTGVWEGEWQNWRMHMECQDDGYLNEIIPDGFTPFENERPKVQSTR
jgi:hypothetical protein